MSDVIAIVPELSFSQQIFELAFHLSRSLPAAEQASNRDFVATFESQLKTEDGSEVSSDIKKEVVRSLVGKFRELRGGLLEAAKENDAESSHLLLQVVLSATFDGAEYEELVKSIITTVGKNGELALGAGRTDRAEAAARILNNTYNFLAPSSPLRPMTLLTLLSLLSKLSDLHALPLTSSYLSAALAQWAITSTDKVDFLTAASSIYEKGGDLAKAFELHTLALSESVEDKVVERAVVLNLASAGKFGVDILAVQGVQQGIKGKLAELVELFEGSDELEAVPKGKAWVESNGSFIEGFSIAQFSAESILRKLRLIALAALCARSQDKQIEYAQVAAALLIEPAEVETWVIDAIRANLLNVRLSQPTSTIRILSVSSQASRRFGNDEWQLLQTRLEEWKRAVDEARRVISEAESMAAQGPLTHQRRPQGQSQREEIIA